MLEHSASRIIIMSLPPLYKGPQGLSRRLLRLQNEVDNHALRLGKYAANMELHVPKLNTLTVDFQLLIAAPLSDASHH